MVKHLAVHLHFFSTQTKTKRNAEEPPSQRTGPPTYEPVVKK